MKHGFTRLSFFYGFCLLLAALMALAVACGGEEKETPTSPTPQATRTSPTAGATVTPMATPKATPTATPKPTPTPAPPTATPEPAGYSFGSGKKLVGSEIQATTYRTRSASDGCYWERLSGLGGTLQEIIANDNSSGPVVVTIASSDVAFNSTRCAKWTQDLSPITKDPAVPFAGGGTYIVGVDIAPGTWRSSGTGSCYWERESGFSGELADIIANDNATGPTLVEIGAGDNGFKSSAGCGTWTKVQ